MTDLFACNAPASFQKIMDKVLGRCSGFTKVYLDDIIVFSDSPEGHLAHLTSVLQALQQAGLKANKKKCKFASLEVDYLGHRVSEGSVKQHPDKLRIHSHRFGISPVLPSIRLGITARHLTFGNSLQPC